MLEKDPFQETVFALKRDQSLKTTIGNDTELRLPIWHCGTCEAFLMHVSAAVDTIKKRVTFKIYKEACEAYVEQRKMAKQAKAGLAILNAAVREVEKTTKKTPRNLPRKLLSRLLRRPRKTQLWLMHQTQNCVWSIRLTTKKPSLLQRPPRTSTKPLLLQYFSFTQICCPQMPITRGTRLSRSRQRLIHSRIFKT
jgi:hypothetical protein